MDILVKLLDKAATSHPDCFDPLVTHLSFEDDILIFFNGTAASLERILGVLNEF